MKLYKFSSFVLLSRIVLALPGLLHFHIHFRMNLSVSKNKNKGCLNTAFRTLLILYVCLGKVDILILSFLIHLYDLSHHLIRPSVFLKSVLILPEIIVCFVRFIPILYVLLDLSLSLS